MKCLLFSSVRDLMQPDWKDKGMPLFEGEVIQRPGFLEYSDRYSFPLVITNSCNSSELKIWVVNRNDLTEYGSFSPSLVLPRDEVKDYRHFQNYFLQIMHPNGLKLRMQLFDLHSGSVLCVHEIVFE